MREELKKALTNCIVHGAKHIDALRTLIEKKDPQISPDYSETWSIFAFTVHEKQFDIAKLVLAKGLDVNAISEETKKSPLHIVANAGSLEMTRYLLDLGATTDVQDDDDKTPVDIARNNGYTEIVTALTQAQKKQTTVALDSPMFNRTKTPSPTNTLDDEKKIRLQKSRE